MDLYEILEVGKKADDKTIKSAYRRLSAIHHPDKEGGDAEMFQKIKDAYEVLKDKTRRRRYDRTGSAEASVVTDELIERQIESTLSDILDQRIDRDYLVEADLEYKDVLLVMIEEQERARTMIDKALARLRRKLKKCQSLMRRFKTKGRKDLVKRVLERKEERILSEITVQENSKELSLKVTESLNKYKYEVGPEPEGQVSPGPTPRLTSGGARVVRSSV